jgi:hypothetical protein
MNDAIAHVHCETTQKDQSRKVTVGFEHLSIAETAMALCVGVLASVAGGGLGGVLRVGDVLGIRLAVLFGMFFGVLGGAFGVVLGLIALALIQ